jgi:hypothetical protein
MKGRVTTCYVELARWKDKVNTQIADPVMRINEKKGETKEMRNQRNERQYNKENYKRINITYRIQCNATQMRRMGRQEQQ